MNCQLFESVVVDLVRNLSIDTVVRQDGITHAKECVRCGRLFATEKQLSAVLKRLADADRSKTAPERVENNVLEAFRRQAVVPHVPIVVFDARQRFSRKRFRWYAAAAAASISIMFAAAAMRLIGPRSESVEPRELAKTDIVDHGNRQTPPQDLLSTGHGDPEMVDREHGTVVKVANTPGKQRYARRRTYGAAGNVSTPLPGVARENLVAEEIVTDFIPVSYTSSISSFESGRVVRVELPRTALASFGLPVNMAQANGRVKADLLMDDYGTAQAIRFIR
jgi:hypothetical protein